MMVIRPSPIGIRIALAGGLVLPSSSLLILLITLAAFPSIATGTRKSSGLLPHEKGQINKSSEFIFQVRNNKSDLTSQATDDDGRLHRFVYNLSDYGSA